MRRRAHTLCASVVVALGAASVAHGDVPLHFTNCAKAQAANIRKLISIELGLRPLANVGARRMQVTISCDSASAAIELKAPKTKAPLRRSVSLRNMPGSARARLIALAVVETIESAATELERLPAKKAQPKKEPAKRWPPPLVHVERNPSDGKLQVSALANIGAVGVASERSYTTYGATLRGDLDLTTWLSVGLDSRVSLAAPSVNRGAVSVLAWSVAPGASFTAFASQILRVRGGLGLRIGYVRLRGSASSPTVSEHTVDGLFVTPFVGVDSTIRIFKRLFLTLGIEAGIVARRFRGRVNETQAVPYGGGDISALLGLAFR